MRAATRTGARALFRPLQCGDVTLGHRVVLAPLTRMRAAEPGQVPWELNAEYYAQRASAGGLLIAEATQVSQQGQGYPSTPGIFTDDHVAGWRRVTDAIHAKAGAAFLQLWHVGRISHPCFQPEGRAPVSASAVTPAVKALTPEGPVPAVEPRALELGEIGGVVASYAAAAARAKAAGFDGVELHAANGESRERPRRSAPAAPRPAHRPSRPRDAAGYLIDQFLNDGCNRRTDEYGGCVENRARLLFECLDACVSAFGAGRVGIRLSPHEGVGPNDARDSDPSAIYGHVLEQLSARYGASSGRALCYVHLIETTRPFASKGVSSYTQATRPTTGAPHRAVPTNSPSNHPAPSGPSPHAPLAGRRLPHAR